MGEHITHWELMLLRGGSRLAVAGAGVTGEGAGAHWRFVCRLPPLFSPTFPPCSAPAPGNINQLVLKLSTYCAELHRHGGVRGRACSVAQPRSV